MLKNKTAIVTGGAKRVGQAISLALAESGYDVIIIYNSSAEGALATKSQVEKLGRKASIYKCDLAKLSDIKQTVTEIFNLHKNITLLVNNASIFEKASFAKTDEDLFERNLDINFKAPFFLTQYFAEYCSANNIQGHVVNILDSYIYSNRSPYFIYLLTKKTLADFTKMAAAELSNIRVNAISIGMLLTSEDWDEEKIAAKVKTLPVKRVANMQEITKTILFLDENQYITGENIAVDGGLKLIG